VKIVHLVAYFQPKLGYQEFFLAREMQRLGHKVNVVTSNYYFPFPDYMNSVYKVLGERQRKVGFFREKGIPVHRLPIYCQSGNGAVVILGNLRETLLSLKPDVVYCDGVFSPLSAMVAFYKRKIGYRLFYDNHASSFNTNLRDSQLKKIYMFFFKKFIIPYIKEQADGFVAVGDSERIILCQEYGLRKNEVKLIRLGADTSTFYPDIKKRTKMRQKFKIKNDQVLVIYAGKVIHNKDLDILFRAFLLAFKKTENLKLMLVGGGDEELVGKLKLFARKNHIENQIIWHQLVENRFLADYYNAADIGIWPGNPSNTIFEALACGLPVILPKRIYPGHTSDHFLTKENGFAFKKGDYRGLAKHIIKMGKDKRLRREMSINSRLLSVEKFSWEKIARHFLKLV